MEFLTVIGVFFILCILYFLFVKEGETKGIVETKKEFNDYQEKKNQLAITYGRKIFEIFEEYQEIEGVLLQIEINSIVDSYDGKNNWKINKPERDKLFELFLEYGLIKRSISSLNYSMKSVYEIGDTLKYDMSNLFIKRYEWLLENNKEEVKKIKGINDPETLEYREFF